MIVLTNGKVSDVGHLVRVGLPHKDSIHGSILCFDKVATDLYKHKDFNEKDELCTLLLWNHIAGFTLRRSYRDMPSFDKLDNGANSLGHLAHRRICYLQV